MINWKTALGRIPVPRRGGRQRPLKYNRLEASFLAGAQEIEEMPPSPTARLTAWLVIALICFAVAWAYFGRVDVVIVATGKIIPDNRVKTVQAATQGIVREILVGDGDVVAKGQVLFVMDHTSIDAGVAQIEEQVESLRLKVAMHDAVLGRMPEPGEPVARLAEVAGLEDIDKSRLERQQEVMDEIVGAHLDSELRLRKEAGVLHETVATLREQIGDLTKKIEFEKRSNAQEQTVMANEISKLQRLLPLTVENHELMKRLEEGGVASKLEVRAAEEKLVAMRSDLEISQSKLDTIKVHGEGAQIELEDQISRIRRRIQELTTEIDAKEHQIVQLRSEFRKRHTEEREAAAQSLSGLRQELVKLMKERESYQVRSPAAGVAQQLAIHTEGGVVQPSQPLLIVVPSDPVLEIEAFVENKDIGFVHPGQPVEVKVDTFPYTKYGLLQGEVVHVAGDAVNHDPMGLVYPARIRLDSTTVRVEGKDVRLAPGMSVAAEIKTGTRRVAEFFLAPLLRTSKESFRER